MANEKVDRLKALYTEITHISHIHAVLSYDQETVMPPDGAADRAEQISFISGLAHEKAVAPELLGLAEELWAARATLRPEDAANVRETRRMCLRAKKLPAELVTEMARTTSLAHHAWIAARKRADFPAFAPWLEKIVGLKRQEAEAIGYEKDPYDALLDGFEPDCKVAQLDPLFSRLREELVPLVTAVKSAPRQPRTELLGRRVGVDRQREFSLRVAYECGFVKDGGRLDISAHPFCSTLGTGDTRITTRYREDEPMSSFFGVLHETGHALYEQGLDPKHAGTPMGNSISLGIHESQSRTWENMVGRSHAFWKHYYSELQKAFAPTYDDVSRDDFYFAVNNVRPSLIRVEADEVTYNLHILIRYEMERDLFAGKLTVNDLPKTWNTKMQQYLGVTPPDDAEGVLQDVHWGSGLIGYFPTYTLGNLYGAQLFDAARRAIPDLDARIEKGDLKTLREWQREHIHRLGMLYSPPDLVKHATGSAPDTAFYMRYLNEKFGPLYGIHGGVGAR